MDTQQRTQIPPPPKVPAPPPAGRDGSLGIVGLFLVGVFAWLAAGAMWAGAEDAADPAKNYTATIALTIVGGVIMLVAAIYDRD